MGVDLFGLPSFLHLKMGTPQRRMAFVGRGEAKTQAVFSACGKCSGVSCASTNWGSVVLKEYTPSVFGYAESTSLREGGTLSPKAMSFCLTK